MPASLEDCEDHFRGSVLENAQCLEDRILDSAETAIFYSLDRLEIESTWQLARDALETTNRWPIVSTGWAGGEGFIEHVTEADSFSRFFFDETPGGLNQSPKALIERSKSVDVDSFLARRAERLHSDESQDYVDQLLNEAANLLGDLPAYDNLDQSLIYTPHMIDRAIFDYEVANGLFNPNAVYRWDWYEPDLPFLVLLPTQNSWETLAYMHWWGMQNSGAEYYVALGNRWHEEFGAELVCHYGTMLQAAVSRPPIGAEIAWSLAREHNLASDYQLAVTGTEIRQYASGLIDNNRWFLHDRP